MWDSFAPNYTRVAAAQTDVAIGTGGTTGGSVRIYNISCDAPGGGTLLLEEFGTTNVIFLWTFAAGATAPFTLGGNGFLAAKGIQVTTSANVTATLFHSNVGA